MIPPPRPAWAGRPYEARDRGVRALVRLVAPTIHVDILDRRPTPALIAGRPVHIAEQRDLRIRIRDHDLRGLETISGLSYAISVQPRGPAAAVYLLANAATWGAPHTLYADEAGNARDYTAEWRAILHPDAESARAAARDAAGLHLTPLTLTDLETTARAWL